MAECPNKAAYQFMDLDTRTAAFFNIPFKMREDPFRMIGVIGSLKQQRFITAVLQVNNDIHWQTLADIYKHWQALAYIDILAKSDAER